MSQVVTRFAPSPTGLMHLGNVRTALLNWLFARKHGGQFRLRFEDTDQERSEQAFVDAIKQDLQWLGLDWDGEVLFQSAHADKHRQALQTLADKGLAYRCFCSEHQLALDRKLATSRGLPPRYSGRCRVLSASEAEAKAADTPHVWRLAIRAEQGEVVVPDMLRGDVRFALNDLDDPVVVRSEGSFTFLLPNAVDDALDGITHALRGDDHLTNSAYQVWLLQHTDMAVPTYLHHGLLLGSDGAKLSKRTGSHSVQELRESGLLPLALVQAMTRLGHPNISEDIMAASELFAHFEAERISCSSVRWSDEEMWRWHTRLLHALPAADLAGLLEPVFPDVPEDQRTHLAALIGGNLSRVEEALAFARLLDVTAPIDDAGMQVLRSSGQAFFAQALNLWQAHASQAWKPWSQAIKDVTGCGGKALFMPLRVALTGQLHGPEMSQVITYLGEEGVQVRLQDVLQRLSVAES